MSAVPRPFVGIDGAIQYAGDVIMRRHRHAPPPYWAVILLPDTKEVASFFAIEDSIAVVDDFGNLVRVPS